MVPPPHQYVSIQRLLGQDPVGVHLVTAGLVGNLQVLAQGSGGCWAGCGTVLLLILGFPYQLPGLLAQLGPAHDGWPMAELRPSTVFNQSLGNQLEKNAT